MENMLWGVYQIDLKLRTLITATIHIITTIIKICINIMKVEIIQKQKIMNLKKKNLFKSSYGNFINKFKRAILRKHSKDS